MQTNSRSKPPPQTPIPPLPFILRPDAQDYNWPQTRSDENTKPINRKPGRNNLQLSYRFAGEHLLAVNLLLVLPSAFALAWVLEVWLQKYFNQWIRLRTPETKPPMAMDPFQNEKSPA